MAAVYRYPTEVEVQQLECNCFYSIQMGKHISPLKKLHSLLLRVFWHIFKYFICSVQSRPDKTTLRLGRLMRI